MVNELTSNSTITVPNPLLSIIFLLMKMVFTASLKLTVTTNIKCCSLDATRIPCAYFLPNQASLNITSDSLKPKIFKMCQS